MDELLQHPKIILQVLIAYWAFNAFVSGMPDPPAGSFWYKWAYATLHAFAGNIRQFADSRIQTLETSVTRSPDQIKTKVTQTVEKKEK